MGQRTVREIKTVACVGACGMALGEAGLTDRCLPSLHNASLHPRTTHCPRSAHRCQVAMVEAQAEMAHRREAAEKAVARGGAVREVVLLP